MKKVIEKLYTALKELSNTNPEVQPTVDLIEVKYFGNPPINDAQKELALNTDIELTEENAYTTLISAFVNAKIDIRDVVGK